MKFDIAEYFKHVYLFSGLPQEKIEQLAKNASLGRYKKNISLFEQGNKANAFFIIVNGKVSIFKVSANGQEQIIHVHSDGEILAEAAMFDKIKYPASCKTIIPSLIIKVPKDVFIKMILENPELSLKVLAAYSKRLREFVTMLGYLSLDKVEHRMLRYFNANKIWENGRYIIPMKMNKKELSHFLGTIPETLSRNLKKLKDSGLIAEENKSFIIKDIKKINQLISEIY
ncbi:MAG: Crp/Fnr family transcriptional regulator [Bacteriovoracaceae bacterium]|nr:Crp/Fnr family transcriptional regulator [Bacteriovoracaceae bacterium]